MNEQIYQSPSERKGAPQPPPPASQWPRVFPWLALKWDRVLPWIIAGASIAAVIGATNTTSRELIASVHDDYRHALTVWESDIRGEIAAIRSNQRVDTETVFDILQRVAVLEKAVFEQNPDTPLLRCAPRAEGGCRIDGAECGGGRSVPSACLERNGGTAERRPDESG